MVKQQQITYKIIILFVKYILRYMFAEVNKMKNDLNFICVKSFSSDYFGETIVYDEGRIYVFDTIKLYEFLTKHYKNFELIKI